LVSAIRCSIVKALKSAISHLKSVRMASNRRKPNFHVNVFSSNMTANDPTQDPISQIDPALSAESDAGMDAVAGAPVEPGPEQKLVELQARHAEVADAYLRAKAEIENVRRRSEDEASKARKFAIEGFAASMLPVRDSLEAALAIQNATPEQLREGVGATLRQLAAALERNKVLEIQPPAGTRFDPHQHQAISAVAADQDPNTVVSVLQKGYSIAERVLRPALVTVAAAK
jgi:molecular chaperone GrpE